ncbi:hypothetical protein KAR34_02945 [bacterium]|nr:hypothetical protein [bacterium]
MLNQDVGYIDYLYLLDALKEYASPKAKITRMIKSNEIIKVRRGLYVWPHNTNVSLKTLANKIYGPSYISFEYALSFYGLIPERVHTITSASMGKNKSKLFTTPLGAFFYQSVPAHAYPYGIDRRGENGSPFLIAGREKALCDTLIKAGRVTSIKKLKMLLYEDLRMEREALFLVNQQDMAFLSEVYEKGVITLLCQYLEKGERYA